MSAIRLKAKKVEGKYDLGASKFLGDPVLPEKWLDIFDEFTLFLMQIRLEDIKDLDEENILPHEGYLYIFLDTSGGEYNLQPMVKYYKGEPTHSLEGFNSICPDYERFTDAFLIEFEKCEDESTGNKLFGCPADWNYQDEPRRLLFQFDPLDSEMGLFDNLDGLLYFFFDGKLGDLKKIKLQEEYS